MIVFMGDLAWITINTIGLIVQLWLVDISYIRQRAVIEEKFPITPKPPRIRTANRQILERSSVGLFHLGAITLGGLKIAGAPIPGEAWVWLLCGIVGVLVFLSAINLYGELQR